MMTRLTCQHRLDEATQQCRLFPGSMFPCLHRNFLVMKTCLEVLEVPCGHVGSQCLWATIASAGAWNVKNIPISD